MTTRAEAEVVVAEARAEAERKRAERAAAKKEQAEDRAQWLATLKAQETAAEFAGELAAAQGDVLAKIEELLGRLAPQDDGSGKYNSVWSMALALAVQRESTIGEQQANRDLLADAAWFYGRLMAGPPALDGE